MRTLTVVSWLFAMSFMLGCSATPVAESGAREQYSLYIFRATYRNDRPDLIRIELFVDDVGINGEPSVVANFFREFTFFDSPGVIVGKAADTEVQPLTLAENMRAIQDSLPPGSTFTLNRGDVVVYGDRTLVIYSVRFKGNVEEVALNPKFARQMEAKFPALEVQRSYVTVTPRED